MNKKRINIIMAFLLGASAFAIMIGALLKLEHYPYGDIFFKSGFIGNFVFGSIEIARLKRENTRLRKGQEVTE